MRYRILERPFDFPAGFMLRLDQSQAHPRLHRLSLSGAGVYAVVEAVQFKAGEVVDVVSGDLGRAGDGRLEALSDPAPLSVGVVEELPLRQPRRRA